METKLKHKAGDKVRVKSLDWYDFYKDVRGDVYNNTWCVFVRDMARYCGKVLNITKLKGDFYVVEGNIYSWQDWMFEDKVVTEEKQEVEQLNKNTMETKKMKLQEAQEFVKNTKYIVWSEDESRQLQEKLFEIGCRWLHSDKTICHEEHPFLMVDESLNIRYREKQWYTYFEEDKKRYIETYHILNMELETEQPKPKFDPNTLQPFDKVLVREEGKQWLARFFDIYEGGYNVTSGHSWTYCIPYNEETKHLHGTCNEAPEFYQLD